MNAASALLYRSSVSLLPLADTDGTAAQTHLATLVHLSTPPPPLPKSKSAVHWHGLMRQLCRPPAGAQSQTGARNGLGHIGHRRAMLPSCRLRDPELAAVAKTPSGLPTRKPARARAEEDCSGGWERAQVWLRRKGCKMRKKKASVAYMHETGEEGMRQVAAAESLGAVETGFEMHRKRRLKGRDRMLTQLVGA